MNNFLAGVDAIEEGPEFIKTNLLFFKTTGPENKDGIQSKPFGSFLWDSDDAMVRYWKKLRNKKVIASRFTGTRWALTKEELQ
jgi:hypothetical protein